MAYRRAGIGPVVVLVHGIPGSGAAWEPVAESLPSTLDVIVPDLLGFGSSERPSTLEDLHAEAQASALGALLDDLEIEKATLVGHDFGGPVVLTLAKNRPSLVEALGIFATNAFTDTPIPFPLSLTTKPVIGPVMARALFSGPSLRMLLGQAVGPGASAPDPTTYLGDGSQQRAIATIFAGSLDRIDELYRPIEDSLGDHDVPTFVGWGDHDPFFDLAQGQRTADALGVDLRVYEGAGHFLPHERPADLAADIEGLVQLK